MSTVNVDVNCSCSYIETLTVNVETLTVHVDVKH